MEARLRRLIEANAALADWRIGRTRRIRERVLHLAGHGAPKAVTDVTSIPRWSWRNLGPSMLPFADAATKELPLGRLLRLSLFQVTVGMAAVLLIGTLNRVMIVELALPAWLVAPDDFVTSRIRAVSDGGRLSLRHPSIGAGLAAGTVHLVRHSDAVRRTGHNAVRTDPAFRRFPRSADHRAGERRPGFPGRRRRPAYDPDGGAGAGHGSRACPRWPEGGGPLCFMLLVGTVVVRAAVSARC